MIDFIAAIERESRRFLEVLSTADPDARVPSCPDWDAAELTWHLTEVQMFWRLIVEHRFDDPAAAAPLKASRPGSFVDLLEMFEAESSRLVATLAATPSETRVWSWYPDGWTVGWVQRRQAHEVLIHRVDAELVRGAPSPLDPYLAADGVDEILRTMIDGLPDWARFEPDGSTALLVARDVDTSWPLTFGRFLGTPPTGDTTYDLDMARVEHTLPADPGVVISGPSSDLDAWLWGRGELQDLQLEGDARLADRLREIATESTQ